jgi:hypothetical protein
VQHLAGDHGRGGAERLNLVRRWRAADGGPDRAEELAVVTQRNHGPRGQGNLGEIDEDHVIGGTQPVEDAGRGDGVAVLRGDLPVEDRLDPGLVHRAVLAAVGDDDGVAVLDGDR